MKPKAHWISVAIFIALSICSAAAAQRLAESQEVKFLDEAFAFDAKNAAVGAWLGNIVMPSRPTLAAALVIEKDEKGGLEILLTCLQMNARDAICTDIAVKGRSLAFSLAAGAVEARFEGEISADGQRFVGSIIQEGRDGAGTFTLARTPRAMDLAKPMAFTGRSRVSDSVILPMTIALARTPGGHWVGHLDSPHESLYELPLFNFSAEATEEGTLLTCTLLSCPATIEVTISKDQERLTGHYLQDPYDLPIEYQRGHGYAGGKVNRPQHPRPPFPYETREVVAAHPGGHVLAGTLTIPDRKRFGPGPFPTAVLISGSGPHDRDETIVGHKIFLVIADYLTRRGITVMRYDDRGVGGSDFDGDLAALFQLTSEDYATDTLAVVSQLKTIDVVDADRIGLIGHGEGGLIAPMVAQTSGDIAFLVLLAGPGVPGRQLVPLQLSLLPQPLGMSSEDAETLRRIATEAIEQLLADEDRGKLERTFKRMAELRAAGGDPTPIETVVAAYQEFFAMPWTRFFLAYDPRPALAATTCPVLALNGTLDLQVWHEQNLPEIQRVITEAGGDVTIKTYQGLNHLFQPAGNGTIAEYAQIETTFDEQVLRDIAIWIRKKVRPNKAAASGAPGRSADAHAPGPGG